MIQILLAFVGGACAFGSVAYVMFATPRERSEWTYTECDI